MAVTLAAAYRAGAIIVGNLMVQTVP